MTAQKLIEILKQVEPDSVVICYWDSAPRSGVSCIYTGTEDGKPAVVLGESDEITTVGKYADCKPEQIIYRYKGRRD